MAFISAAAHSKTGSGVIRRVYDNVHISIFKDLEANPSPMTMVSLEPHIEDLRVQFNTKGLDTAAKLRCNVSVCVMRRGRHGRSRCHDAARLGA